MNLLAWIQVDPNPIVFYIPYINHPITWYGCIFAFSFWLGYNIFIWLYIRYSLYNKKILKKDLTTELPTTIEFNKDEKKILFFFKKYTPTQIVQEIKIKLYLEKKFPESYKSTLKSAIDLADKGLLYIILSTIIGARLGHIIFYENIMDFIHSPLSIIKVWEGGLASHGGIIAIIFSSYLFIKKYKPMSYLQFLDLLSIPTMLVCGSIRIGNFINQEILGATTINPLAIIFTHPADGSVPTPRHPIQLYESMLYFCVFLTLFILWKRYFTIKLKGFYVGLALFISFSLRFLLEFLKTPESIYDNFFSLNMGQILSIPLCFLGFLLIKSSLLKKKKVSLDKKTKEY